MKKVRFPPEQKATLFNWLMKKLKLGNTPRHEYDFVNNVSFLLWMLECGAPPEPSRRLLRQLDIAIHVSGSDLLYYQDLLRNSPWTPEQKFQLLEFLLDRSEGLAGDILQRLGGMEKWLSKIPWNPDLPSQILILALTDTEYCPLEMGLSFARRLEFAQLCLERMSREPRLVSGAPGRLFGKLVPILSPADQGMIFE